MPDIIHGQFSETRASILEDAFERAISDVSQCCCDRSDFVGGWGGGVKEFSLNICSQKIVQQIFDILIDTR
jgi:hypothetical protein